MTKKAILKAINLLSSVLTKEDTEMQELVRQLMNISAQAPDVGSTMMLCLQVQPKSDKVQPPALPKDGRPYQFRDDIMTIVPTACLVEDVQRLSLALKRADDPDYLRNSNITAYDAEEILRDEAAVLVECLADIIEQFTVVPPDLEITPSGSSLVAMGMENGIIVGADGKDITCRAGHPISAAMSGACCQCNDSCPHFQACFGDASVDLPRYGRIAPMEMDIDLRTTDDDVVNYLDNALRGGR